MSPEPSPNATPEHPADWEAFYRNYRKPGYVAGFEITTKLGSGVFGQVYRARRLSIGKDYAIKFLNVDDGEVRRAVLQELEQVKFFAQVDHPNLVAIEDRGEVDGIPYLVMAYAGSETLRDRMRAGQVPTGAAKDELLRVFLQAVRGLSALHERALVHFDIKPENVFLKGSVARLGDYGLSKLVTHSRQSLSMGRGTPYYMAPEMLRRKGDHRSDIYSLGVLLYELLCGAVPFTGDSEWEVLKQHETRAPELPAHLSAVERAVIARCLQKDPQQRFASVAELIATFGAPATAGAAAWGDVQAGTLGAKARPRPARPADEGDAAGKAQGQDDDNPYRELTRASQKAIRHASQVAREAMRDAEVVTRKAAKQASEAVRDSWKRTRGFGTRRLHALHRLHQQRRERRRRERAQARADRAAHGRFGRVLGQLVAFALVAVAVAVAWLGGSVDQSRATVAVSVAPPPRPLSAAPTFAWSSVPEAYDDLVSKEEPPWAALAQRSPAQAKRLLLAHINRLRQRAPLSAEVRRAAERLPSFAFAEDNLAAHDARARLRQVLAEGIVNSARLTRFAAQGPLELAVVAEHLTQLSWRNRDQALTARRLHAALRTVTGCRDLEALRGDGDVAAACNQPLGELWMWFVNEFAHSERTWWAYRRLLGMR